MRPWTDKTQVFFVQQATFCVNYLAHWLGEQPFDDRNSPRDHILTALITLGEGYHNFHHEFPSDYRNAIEWWQYDPTKWMIWAWKQLGLASDMKQFRANKIEKRRVQQQQKLDRKGATLDWGIQLEQLPIVSWDDFVGECRENGKKLYRALIFEVCMARCSLWRETEGGKVVPSRFK